MEQIEPGRFLVLAIRQPHAVTSFTCAVRPAGPDRTRMLFRLRLHAEPTLPGLAFLAAVDPGDFVMMRHMMYGIRRRAETLHRESAAAPG